MTDSTAPSDQALRQRAYRERRRLGFRVVSLEVHAETIDGLIARGLIGPDDCVDQIELAFALGFLLQEIAHGKKLA